MVANPSLFVDGISETDCVQGAQLGNCWFVAACSALTHNKHLFDKVIPGTHSTYTCHQFHSDHKLQNNAGNFHTGIFRFRLWCFGEWVDVVVDDFLPTENDKLTYAHSRQTNEFWCALLEKAFAKSV
jgi:calpain-5